MASVALSVGDVLPIRRIEVRRTVRSARKWTASGLMRAIAAVAGSFLFLGILGWEVWRIGGHVPQLAVVMAGATGSDPVVQAGEPVCPTSGTWPW